MKSVIKQKLRENLLKEKMVLKDYSTYIQLVAKAYNEATDYDSSAISHWNSLNQSNHSLFKRLLSKVNLVFTTNDPNKVGVINIDGKQFKIDYIRPDDEYKTQSEMKQSFQETGILKISIDNSEHPLFSVEDNIIFRTVHDYIAHILGNHDFGAKGEIACYNLHAKMAPNNAIPALFTEVVGQAATTIVTGDFPKQKIVVLKGFDYNKLGEVEDTDYEIKDKALIKKGETPKTQTNINRAEPKAIHTKDKEMELAENVFIEGKDVSRKYLKQLLNHVSNNLGIKLLMSWIKRGDGEMVKLSNKEYTLLNLIKKGGPNPSDFSSKN